MAEKYVIEKGIPLDPVRRPARSPYPFAEMEVGDSFLVEGVSNTLRCRLNSAAAYWRKNVGNTDWRFATREADGGVRVFRTK